MSSPELATINLPAYFARIGYNGPLEPGLQTLQALHLAHATHIPFENLDVLCGRPVLLDLSSLQTKLVQNRRGGWCFEQNALLAAALEQLGFQVTRLAARVRFGITVLRPRLHMLLLVHADETPWVADVGFGGQGLFQPLPLVPGRVAEQFGWRYRLVQEGPGWVLQWLRGDTWFDLYAFTLEPQHPVDYEPPNHYTATHPTSIFRRTLTAQLPTPQGRHIVRGRVYTIERPGADPAPREVAGDAELLDLLAEVFGIRLPPGTRLPTIEPFPLH